MTVLVRIESSSPPLGSKPVLLPDGPIVVPGNTDEVGTPVVGLVGIPKVEFPVDGVPVVKFPVVGVPVVGVLVELQKSYSISTLKSS